MKKEVNLRGILRKKKGQIWVETMIYTLIAFGLIGLILAFAGPKIEEIQDREVIERSMNALEEIDFIISTIGGPGNQRVIDLRISKGSLNIDGENDEIFFDIDSRYEYSEPGQNINIGNVIVRTEDEGRLSKVTLTLNYDDRYNITFGDQDELGTMTQSPTPYNLVISNRGDDGNKTIINIEEVN